MAWNTRPVSSLKFFNWLFNFPQAQCCQLLTELSGQSKNSAIEEKNSAAPVLSLFEDIWAKKTLFLSVWMEKNNISRIREDKRKGKQNFLKCGPYSTLSVQNQTKLGRRFIRQLQFLVGSVWVMRPNNQPVCNNEQALKVPSVNRPKVLGITGFSSSSYSAHRTLLIFPAPTNRKWGFWAWPISAIRSVNGSRHSQFDVKITCSSSRWF